MAGPTEPLFSETDVAELRQLSESTLLQTARIERPGAPAADATGTSSREPYTDIALAAPCRLAITPPAELERAGRLGPDAQYTLTFRVGEDVRAGDRVTVNGSAYSTITESDQAYTKTVHVIGPAAPHTFQAMLRVYASELPLTEARPV